MNSRSRRTSRSATFSRRELDRVTIRVSEVQAHSPQIPCDAALDLNSRFREPLLPLLEIIPLDSEREMRWSCRIVRRNPAGRTIQSLSGLPAIEQQQNAFTIYIECDDAVVLNESRKAEESPIEVGRSRKVIAIESRLENPVHSQHVGSHTSQGKIIREASETKRVNLEGCPHRAGM